MLACRLNTYAIDSHYVKVVQNQHIMTIMWCYCPFFHIILSIFMNYLAFWHIIWSLCVARYIYSATCFDAFMWQRSVWKHAPCYLQRFLFINKKHLKNVGPIHYCEPPLHCQSTGVASCTPAIAVARAACDVHNDDNAWQRGPLWPHGMGPKSGGWESMGQPANRDSHGQWSLAWCVCVHVCCV